MGRRGRNAVADNEPPASGRPCLAQTLLHLARNVCPSWTRILDRVAHNHKPGRVKQSGPPISVLTRSFVGSMKLDRGAQILTVRDHFDQDEPSIVYIVNRTR
jgi:hypothetical protein